VFILLGIAVLVGVVSQAAHNSPMKTIGGILAGLGFAIIGGYPYYRGRAVFDRRQGWFTRGRRVPGRSSGAKSGLTSARLDDIRAVQLLSKSAGSNQPYVCYELNVVLGNGERINVVAHGDTDKLREDAATLAAFLKKPLWDKT